MDERIKKVIECIGKNAWHESRALYPNPTWHVHVSTVLDSIRDSFDLTKEEIDAVLVAAQEEK